MKRLISFISLAICCFFFSCEKAPEEIPVSSVTLNQPAAEMIVGETVQLSATILPSNATEKALTWASSKQSVATVSNSGLVTAVAEGTSTITVSAGGKSANCAITVKEKVIPVTSVALNKTELSLNVGGEYMLVATVKPDDATDKIINWKSSDESVVTVKDGKVTAKKEGSATVTATAGDKSASCKVTIDNNNVIYYTSSDGKSVTPLWPEHFGAIIISNTYENGQGKLTFDGNVTYIGTFAFKECSNLASIIIPKSVTSISNYAFADCASLTSIVIPESVKSIGDGAFQNCTSLTSIIIPKNVTTIKTCAFSGCTSLTSVSIPENVTSIGNSAFENCSSLISITIPDSVTSIGSLAFAECTSLTSAVIPESVTSIGSFAFYRCTSLTSVVIPKSVTTIEVEVFSLCTKLTSVVIPEGVTSIEGKAFYMCRSLSSVVIPESVTSIGGYAFWSCSSLTSIYCRPSIPPTAGNKSMFESSYCPIYVPAGSVEAYKTAHLWNTYADRIQAIPE